MSQLLLLLLLETTDKGAAVAGAAEGRQQQTSDPTAPEGSQQHRHGQAIGRQERWCIPVRTVQVTRKRSQYHKKDRENDEDDVGRVRVHGTLE